MNSDYGDKWYLDKIDALYIRIAKLEGELCRYKKVVARIKNYVKSMEAENEIKESPVGCTGYDYDEFHGKCDVASRPDEQECKHVF